MNDRIVHARGEDGRQIVRYGRASKWWLERADGTKVPLGVAMAVSEAFNIACEGGGDIYWGQPGGSIFDSRLKIKLLAKEQI